MRLITTREWPPEGWTYRDPKTGYQEPAPASNNFQAVARGIQRARVNNPGRYPAAERTMEAAERALTTYTVLRLIRRGLWDRVVVEEGDEAVLVAAGVDVAAIKKKLSQPAPPAPAEAGAVPVASGNMWLNRARRLAGGAALLQEWVGDGMAPVEADQAAQRATTCTRCPLNNTTPGWVSRLTQIASEAMHQQMEVKAGLALRTPHDERLGVCDACLCPLALKVWVPISHIETHLEAGTFWALHPDCWVLAETGTAGAGVTTAEPLPVS